MKNGICQSCGMPMKNEEDFGTEADGSKSMEYCTYCYRNGKFTAPDITIDEMAEKGGAIMSEMFEIPVENAVAFSKEQLSGLKRWAGRDIPLCESCGMPMKNDEEFGTEADGSKSMEYCTYCYRNGKFIEPDMTIDEAVSKYAPAMAKGLNMPLDKAKIMVKTYLSSLPRWQ
ncbi:molecular chaperone DnaK (HSP70) [Methanomicrobium sp. W14]|uniref:zinc ribbon domain-containing protein n=1 Tax=Methanomicrobium sp. W14 TaxID=2817839 RepID=UPI001AE127DA|nr:zinc ribbon domain-containing protein [Methanomicrobium sp. W14]MBP2134593.1 molecular chaperone DnaK (HSP70) [Methanomicrobium sp. W14]